MATQKNNFKIIPSLGKALFTLLVLAYIVWTVGASVYKNYKTNQQIDQLKKEIADLNNDIADLQDIIVYDQTDSFKELEARRRLGAQAPDEQVVILPKETSQDQSVAASSDARQNTSTNDTITTNWSKWWQFIFSNNQ